MVLDVDPRLLYVGERRGRYRKRQEAGRLKGSHRLRIFSPSTRRLRISGPASPRRRAAELMGKATGVCKGKGGSMHIADVDKGMLGANGIVGGGLPLAAGAALTAKTLGTGGVAVCFFGDGASNQGTFHEALNLAAIWKLPVVFVCENNGYAESTPVALPLLGHRHRQPRRRLRDPGRRRRRPRPLRRLRGGRRGDRPRPPRRGPDPDRGQDLPLLRPLPGRHGHLPHRRRAQPVSSERDAIQGVRNYAIEHGLATADELDAIDARVTAAARRGWDAGQSRPLAGPEEASTDVYVSLLAGIERRATRQDEC